MERTELLARLRRARSEAAAGGRGDTVLDRLIAGESDPASLCLALEQHTGIGAVWDADVASAALDWAAIPSAWLKGFVGLPLRSGPGQPVRIGVEDPWDDTVLHKLTGMLGRVPLLVAVSSTVWAACREASELGASDHGGVAAVADQVSNALPLTPALPSSSVVAFVDAAIAQAIDCSASDIHFECDRTGVAVKFRQDGVLTAWQRMDSCKRAEEVVSRIKVLAQLDITERRVPQDGRFRWQGAGAGAGGIDLRVSIMPSIHGEDAVLRLLDKAQLRNVDPSRSLNALGFDIAQAQRIRDLVTLPHGMLLVTGPTGSGKTTTVYAALSESNTGLEKIVTIEDPVEYELPGVLQIPVNERKGLTFAKGLRSILRHDPDRILVGEIRDAETAEIAVQSALTGHQVFTTVHANSIFDVVGRFRHFGLDMFGFMSSLNGVIVQRLLRRLCTACATDRATTAAEQTWLEAHSPVPAQSAPRLWRAVGCAECRSSGYRGRLVVAEVHAIDDRLRDLVTSGASMSALREHVEQLASTTLLRQGAQLAASRATTIEEVRRVVGWL